MTTKQREVTTTEMTTKRREATTLTTLTTHQSSADFTFSAYMEGPMGMSVGSDGKYDWCDDAPPSVPGSTYIGAGMVRSALSMVGGLRTSAPGDQERLEAL